jgi:chemotaxis protein CheD
MPVWEVLTGEIAAVKPGTELCANGVGSCIALAALDPGTRIAGLAHIMLPGRAPEGHPKKERYAEDAIETLLLDMAVLGADPGRLRIAYAGGANVLNSDSDTLCEMNVNSVEKALANKRLPVLARETGGNMRRKVRIDTVHGIVYSATGDSQETPLCRMI